MSTKFEQLLDLIVNEESEKAQELFHAIVVEKSREIYENLIAEEAEEEEMDEAADEEMDESDEEMDESADKDDEEEMDESMDLEDSYSMEADDEEDPISGSGDATDEFGSDIGSDEMGGEEDPEAQEDNAIMDIKTAIQELEAAFAELEQAQGGEASHGGFGSEEEPKIGMDDEDEGMMMGKPAFEGRRITREYTEKVGNDWDKSGSQKGQGQYVGSGSGDKEGAPVEGRSPVSSGKGKPTTGATAGNILKHTADGTSNTGTSPTGKAGGFLSAAKDMGTGNGNVPGGKMGVKNLSAVKGGHGAEKKGSGPGPVGSGTGDKAGQTSVGQAKSPINGAPNRNA
jgi:hypothetical protein